MDPSSMAAVETMRLFIAVDPSDDVRSAIAAVRSRGPANDRVRWTADANLHLTIQFLGEVPPAEAAAVRTALRGVWTPAFDVRVYGLGFFPDERRARVLWAGIRSDGLSRLAGEVRSRMEKLGIGDTRQFRPHLTLARSRGRSTMDPKFVDWAGAFHDRSFGEFSVTRFFLYESRLQPSGPIYSIVERYELDRTPESDSQ